MEEEAYRIYMENRNLTEKECWYRAERLIELKRRKVCAICNKNVDMRAVIDCECTLVYHYECIKEYIELYSKRCPGCDKKVGEFDIKVI